MLIKKLCFITIILFVFILSLAGCGSSGGDDGMATVRGYVVDYNSWAIVGVKIEVGTQATAYTDSNGYFITSKFPIGSYTMSFSKDGYATTSFNVAFSTGNWQFKKSISLNTGIAGGVGNGEQAGIYDAIMTNGNGITPQITYSSNIKALVLIPYNVYSTSGNCWADLEIDLDGVKVSNSIVNDDLDKFTAAKNPDYQGMLVDPALKIRQLEKDMQKELAAKGIQPIICQNIHAQAEPSSSGTFRKVYKNSYNCSFQANRVYSNGNCAVYVDNSQSINSSYIQQMGDTFNQFYNILTQYFGTVGNDIDGTNKIYIVLTDLDDGVGGYFWAGNEYSNSSLTGTNYAGCSNEKEIIFVATGGYTTNPTSWFAWAKSTTAHEFQHLINFTNRMNKTAMETWANEGLSQVAQDIAMTGITTEHDPELEPLVMEFLNNPADNSLCSWASASSINEADYPPAYLFMRYFADRFGTDKLKTIISTDDAAKNSIESISGMSFANIFRDWLTAIVLDYLNYTATTETLYKSWDFGQTKFNNRLGVLPKLGSIYIPDTTGAFLYRTNNFETIKSNISNITVKISSLFSQKFGLRVITIPKPGVNFSFKMMDEVPELIRVK